MRQPVGVIITGSLNDDNGCCWSPLAVLFLEGRATGTDDINVTGTPMHATLTTVSAIKQSEQLLLLAKGR
jgi:hypothetical protein